MAGSGSGSVTQRKAVTPARSAGGGMVSGAIASMAAQGLAYNDVAFAPTIAGALIVALLAGFGNAVRTMRETAQPGTITRFLLDVMQFIG